jgi:tetratricopeptide (TPR) repeat protein
MTQESDQPGEEDDDSSPQTNGLEAGAGPLKLPEMSPPPIPWFGAADGMPVTGPLLHQHIDVQAANEAAAGDDLLRRQKFLEAGRRYRQAIRLDSHNEKYHAKLGAAARNAGQPEVAERHLLEAIRLAPHYAPAHQSLTLCYMASGQVELALKHADAALALDPMDIDFIVSRAASTPRRTNATPTARSNTSRIGNCGPSPSPGPTAGVWSSSWACRGRERRSSSKYSPATPAYSEAESRWRWTSSSWVSETGRGDRR